MLDRSSSVAESLANVYLRKREKITSENKNRSLYICAISSGKIALRNCIYLIRNYPKEKNLSFVAGSFFVDRFSGYNVRNGMNPSIPMILRSSSSESESSSSSPPSSFLSLQKNRLRKRAVTNVRLRKCLTEWYSRRGKKLYDTISANRYDSEAFLFFPFFFRTNILNIIYESSLQAKLPVCIT